MQILQGFKAQHQDDTKQIATGVLLYIVVSPKDLLLVGVPTFASCRPPSTDALRLALGTCRWGLKARDLVRLDGPTDSLKKLEKRWNKTEQKYSM